MIFKFFKYFTTIFLVILIPMASFASIKSNINARCAVVMDATNRTILYEKNAHLQVPIASTTKILTALIAINYGDIDRKCTISKGAASMRGSTVGYKAGEIVTLRELLYGLMLKSGNDAAVAIAECISGDLSNFMNVMNEYALSIGLTDSRFVTPHGLDTSDQYCTAYDLAILTSVAKENKVFNEIVATKSLDQVNTKFSRSYTNINKMLWQLDASTGVKTGYTGGAGKCLVTTVVHDNREFIIIVLNSNERWKVTKELYKLVTKS